MVLKTNDEHEFINLGLKIEHGKLVKYVRCTKCGLLVRERFKKGI